MQGGSFENFGRIEHLPVTALQLYFFLKNLNSLKLLIIFSWQILAIAHFAFVREMLLSHARQTYNICLIKKALSFMTELIVFGRERKNLFFILLSLFYFLSL